MLPSLPKHKEETLREEDGDRVTSKRTERLEGNYNLLRGRWLFVFQLIKVDRKQNNIMLYFRGYYFKTLRCA